MPKRIEKYELGKTLGRGTFSKVKIGIDTLDNDKAYAIKIVDRQMIREEKMEAHLKREIAVMKIFKHRHIVQLREVMKSSKHIYIVLELVTGGELFDRIVQAKNFPEAVARRYFQQLICGVAYCHSQGISHRDLKPENLLLDDQDVLKISDFGLSALSKGNDGSSKLLKTTCGTPNYVAPEVLHEKGYDGFKADVWSCGVILFVMLAGYLPFEDSNMNALFKKINKGVFSFPKHFSSKVRRLLSRMLVVNPHKRISVKEIMQDPWFLVNYKPLDSTSSKVQVNDSDVNNSIKEAQETESGPAKKKTSATTLNAFDLVGNMMSGVVNPLVSGAAVRIRRETRFAAKGDDSVVRAHMMKVLERLKANPTMKEKDESKDIKCYIHHNSTLLTFTISIQSTSGGFSMVEVRRRKGDILQFNEFYRHLTTQLEDVIVSKE